MAATLPAEAGDSDEYRYRAPLPTRWNDNDAYGHVNNVVYYSMFDTAITRWLVLEAGLRPYVGEVIGLCVFSSCDFRAPLRFPETVGSAIRIGHLGRSSARYEVALFAEQSDEPAAAGTFTHVYVDRHSRQPTEIPASIRAAMSDLLVPSEAATKNVR
jgi:acyl-CoA thioester hydrolase